MLLLLLLFVAGVEEELDGDRQEVVGAHGPSGRVVLSRRTPRESHRDLQSRQLPVHLQLRVVSPNLAFPLSRSFDDASNADYVTGT